MRSLAALLAAVVCAAGVAGCDDDGAEPGASREATLVLDFQPNAVHAGIYSALRRGYYEDEGIDLEIREPSASTDAPKLLQAGRADFAIMDINDVGIAVERGVRIRPVSAIVHRPLAAVIAADRDSIRTPRDLEGGTVGVTGLPSDDAVLDAVLEADGADPDSVERVTIGFDAIPALAAGRIDAATAFWNAEGVILQRRGVPTREFRVDDYGAGSYAELLLVTSEESADADPESVEAMVAATDRGYREAQADPEAALADLLAEIPELDAGEQRAQLRALVDADAIGAARDPLAAEIAQWLEFASAHDIVERDVVRRELDSGLSGGS